MIAPSIERRTTGLNFYAAGLATIWTWAPYASTLEIEVNGKFNIALKKDDYGYWEYTGRDIQPNDKYWFVIDGQKKVPDPASLSQPLGVHGQSEAKVLDDFPWNDQLWTGIPMSDLIIYELHTGAFSPEETFEGIIKKLDYLKELGITAIEIMPVSQFPGSRNWGYDGVYPFAVQNSYGGVHGLMKLVNTCHLKQIAVILDVVYNHLGPEGNYLPTFGPCFTDKYSIPWGKAINFDDAWCDGIRHFCIDNVLMWFRDFHIDGLRLDAIHAIKDFGAKNILQEIKEYVTELNELSGKNHFLIGECDLNDTKYLCTLEKGGYNLDAQWCDEFHHSLHSLITGEVDGYYSDFGTVKHLAKSFRDAYVYDGIFSPHRKKIFGNKTKELPGNKFVVFAQNHDQIGNRMQGERLASLVDFETLKLAAGAVFLSPFLPLIFMGEEYGETSRFLFFTNHSDPKIIASLVSGRLEEFKSFKNLGVPLNPQLEETFNSSKLQWSFQQQKNQLYLLSFYKELIGLKKFHPGFRPLTREEFIVDIHGEKKIIILHNGNPLHSITAVLNFEKDDAEIDMSPYSCQGLSIILYSAEEKWGGPLKLPTRFHGTHLSVKSSSVIILSTIDN